MALMRDGIEADAQLAEMLEKVLRRALDAKIGDCKQNESHGKRIDDLEKAMVDLKHADMNPIEAAAVTMIAGAQLAMESCISPELRTPVLIALQILVQRFMHEGDLCSCDDHASEEKDREPTQEEAERPRDRKRWSRRWCLGLPRSNS